MLPRERTEGRQTKTSGKRYPSRGGLRLKPKDSFEVRPLRPADFENGFFETLSALSDVGGLTPAEAKKVLSALVEPSRVFVASTGSGKVIGTTTLLVETKFIHRGGRVGHIEDVAVMKGYQGRGVGRSLVEAAVRHAKELGCYKCILDCKPEVVGFYEGLGFSRHEVGMRLDLKKPARR